MRTISTSIVGYASVDQALSQTARSYRVVESARPEDLEARIEAVLAEVAAETPDMLFVFGDLNGAGDGHTFEYQMEFVDPNQVDSAIGLDPSLVRVSAYLAADARELVSARAAAQRRMQEEFEAPSLTLVQTALAGASQGTPYMGALLWLQGTVE